MQNILTEVIQNSLFMSCIILVYWGMTKVFMKKYEAKWRYYSWVIPVIGMLFPLRPHIQIPIKSDMVSSVFLGNVDQYLLPVCTFTNHDWFFLSGHNLIKERSFFRRVIFFVKA